MSQPEQFREEVYTPEGYRPEPVRGDFNGNAETGPVNREPLSREPLGREPMGRELGRTGGRELGRESMRDAIGREASARVTGSPLPGSPLPSGSGGGAGPEAQAQRGVPPGRALQAPTAHGEDPSAMQRAMGILKQAAPFVARLLPLIDGNLGSAIANMFTQRPHAPAPPLDLAPVKNQLSDLQAQQTEFRSTLQEQTVGLKRVEDQLEMVREATDRNTLEQQELMEDLKAVAHKVNMVALGVSVLLVASIVINVVLYLYVKRVLP